MRRIMVLISCMLIQSACAMEMIRHPGFYPDDADAREMVRCGNCLWDALPEWGTPDITNNVLIVFGQGHDDPMPARRVSRVWDRVGRVMDQVDRVDDGINNFWRFFCSYRGWRLCSTIVAQTHFGELFEGQDDELQ